MKVMIIDSASLFAFKQRTNSQCMFDYSELKTLITHLEKAAGSENYFDEFIVICTADPNKDLQMGYIKKYIENSGFKTKIVDYKFCFNDLGRGNNENNSHNRITSASNVLAYELGHLQTFEDVEVTLITDCAELIPILMSCADPDSTFKSIHLLWPSLSMDRRWQYYIEKTKEENSIFKYTDLTPYLAQIMPAPYRAEAS